MSPRRTWVRRLRQQEGVGPPRKYLPERKSQPICGRWPWAHRAMHQGAGGYFEWTNIRLPSGPLLPGGEQAGYAGLPSVTVAYPEKVRSQFLSLRHCYSPTDFSATSLPIKQRLFERSAVLGITETRLLQLGGGIFLQSFVLRHFSMVWEVQRQEGRFETRQWSPFESFSDDRE